MSEIARLIIEQGRAAAEARAQQGQLWGRALSNISQIPAQVMEQRRYQQHLDMQQQELNARVALQQEQLRGASFHNTEAQKAAEAHAALGRAISSAAKVGPDGMLQYDIPTFLKAAQADPHVAEMMHEPADAMQKANDTYVQFKQGQAKSKADVMRAIFSGAVDAGGSPNDISIVAAPFIKEGTITAADLQPTIDQLGQIPDAAKQRAVLRGAAGMKPTYIAGPAGGSLYQTTPGETPSVAATAPPNPEMAIGHAETARHNLEGERIQGLQVGRERAANAETARHNREMEKAANPFGNVTMPTTPGPGQGPAAAPAPGGAQSPNGAAPNLTASTTIGPTGEDFLKQLPPSVASEVKAYAEGKRPFPTGISMYRLQPLIQLVSQYDPTFDAANYNARNKARMDLTSPSGAGGKIVNSLNTAIQHAGRLSDLIEALDNTDTPAANAVKNWWNKQTGGTKVTNFEAVQPQLMKEIERLWRGAGGSEGDINALKSSLAPNMGRQQQREALAEFVTLMEGKLQSTETQRDNVLGPVVSKQVPILFDQNKALLQKIRQRSGATSLTPASRPGIIRARDAQGNIHEAPAGTPLPPGLTLVP